MVQPVFNFRYKMKKQKTGFTIRPNEKTHELLKQISALTGKSKNHVVNQLLDSAVPHLQEIKSALEMIRDKEPENYMVMNKKILESAHTVINSQADLIDSMR